MKTKSTHKRRLGLFALYSFLAIGVAWLIDSLWNQLFVAVGVRKIAIEQPDGQEGRGKKLIIGSILECSYQQAWGLLETFGLLEYVAWPIIQFRAIPGQELPATWIPGQSLDVQLFLFGLIPMGRHSIYLERVNSQTGEIQSRESSAWIKTWDHRILLEDINEQQCLYLDEVEIEAGRWTSLITAFARFYYRYRQTRWQALARRLGAGSIKA